MTRARLGLGVVVAGVLAVGAAATLAPGGDGDAAQRQAGDARAVAWDGRTYLIRHPELPRDRVLTGSLRNGSLRAVGLRAEDVRLLDEDGRPVRSTARFAQGFSHGLYSPTELPEQGPVAQARLGEVVTIAPGGRAPVTLSWRIEDGRAPRHVDLGPVTLELPRSAR